jgi:hypothetical protein
LGMKQSLMVNYLVFLEIKTCRNLSPTDASYGGSLTESKPAMNVLRKVMRN